MEEPEEQNLSGLRLLSDATRDRPGARVLNMTWIRREAYGAFRRLSSERTYGDSRMKALCSARGGDYGKRWLDM
jgi:hypothetical protein